MSLGGVPVTETPAPAASGRQASVTAVLGSFSTTLLPAQTGRVASGTVVIGGYYDLIQIIGDDAVYLIEVDDSAIFTLETADAAVVADYGQGSDPVTVTTIPF